MVYRLDSLIETQVNPVTGKRYEDNWMVFMLTDSRDYNLFVGSVNGCAYTVKISRYGKRNWRLALGDFLGYGEANGKHCIVVVPQDEFDEARREYQGHHYMESLLRESEPKVLVHSTPLTCYADILQDGELKSFNCLKNERLSDEEPIGKALGDPADFSDYVMFGNGGIAGELVVNSKQQGRIVMDADAPYQVGARLYFDAAKIAKDGLLVRDGLHLKVRDRLPLKPYLLFTATAENMGFQSGMSTPRIFSEESDRRFWALDLIKASD